ncbi:MAG TPA: hypothetical protein ENI52_03975 [Thermoplasmata archaeon]|nr:hypothetical protein [Thermoplasmata archaeon]
MSRYTDLRDRIRQKYHLSTSDIDDTVMENLFTFVLEIYSRFRGIRGQKKLTLIENENTYTLSEDVHYIIAVLWNTTYPTDNMLTEKYTTEEYNYPSLRMLKNLKAAIQYANRIMVDQEWQVYDDDGTKKLVLDPVPETDIYVIYRQCYTKDNYPFHDEPIIQYLYEAEMLQYCQSTGIIVQLGDIRYDQRRMDSIIQRLRNKFYSHVQPSVIGRS